MKELSVIRIDACGGISAADLPKLLDMACVEWQKIDELNWHEFPYRPSVEFRIAHVASAILLHYRVSEQSVAAVAANDNGNVWEDSCVEFFSMPGGDGIYYNVECNCAGTLLIGAGVNREDRELAPPQMFDNVLRWASLGREPFAERMEHTTWEVALVLPVEVYFKHRVGSLGGCTMAANFFKCGDRLSQPHFLSWNPVFTPSPDFHRPECFGRLHFE